MRPLYSLPLCVTIAVAGCAHVRHPPQITAPTGSIFADDAPGRGLPIVFVHGNGGSSEQWRAQLEHFRAAGRRAIAIDLPGFGRSPIPSDGVMSLDAMARAIDRVVVAKGIEHFIIVGHSYGGAVVAAYTAAHPRKIAGVVYVEAAASAVALTPPQRAQFTAALTADKMKVVHAWFAPMLAPSSAAVQEAVYASADRTSVDALTQALNSLAEFDAKKLVNSYTGPRLAIVASALETPASFQRQFPEIEAVKIADAGHWVMLDNPTAVNAALDHFVFRVTQTRDLTSGRP